MDGARLAERGSKPNADGGWLFAEAGMSSQLSQKVKNVPGRDFSHIVYLIYMCGVTPCCFFVIFDHYDKN